MNRRYEQLGEKKDEVTPILWTWKIYSQEFNPTYLKDFEMYVDSTTGRSPCDVYRGYLQTIYLLTHLLTFEPNSTLVSRRIKVFYVSTWKFSWTE